jgi:Na+/H+-translocating membrane pyrophosphatase|tara:strand:- start:237 stop:473 length:237 start_codon:yes stop_codon:yes gene_type:complete
MQKVCNVLGVLGFVMSSALVSASIVAFARIPGMIDDMAADMMGDITGNVTEMLPSEIDAALPELPTSTGPALPIKSPF